MLSAQSTEVLPDRWYNIVPDLPEPLSPPIDNFKDKSSIELLNSLLPKEVLRQEFTFNRYETIPDEVRNSYEQIGRPTPLFRAKGFEDFLGYKGKIFIKFEGATVTGSHKINTAIPQAYYARNEGIESVVTETGAGQWGTATALAAAMNNMRSTVFMVGVSYRQKPLRKKIMELYGAKVYSSPSRETETGRKYLEKDSNHPGSLGIAISEASEYTLQHNAKYLVGSVMNSVLTHQSVIGQETIRQLEILGEEADILIGSVGGGSNFGGFVYPFIGQQKDIQAIASTAQEVPKLTRGEYRYDRLDTAGLLPSVKMYSLGHDFVPEGIYSGGLRYHGSAPSLSLLIKNKLVKAEEVGESEVIDALRIFARTQGVVAAPESGHAIASAIRYCRSSNDRKNVLINVSGNGLLDLSIFER
ncbi:MAG: TrpB-like pyridoxal phosphate-dependent enzyme [Candidatus Thermoplasmatota archaeon]|nr:TrpB-like pyridoxal phosphate-dependent enzyme [Candidatus Thermoplasmatota archaeon]